MPVDWFASDHFAPVLVLDHISFLLQQAPLRSANLTSGSYSMSMLLFASQTAQGGPTVILPALLITGLLVAASQAFVPKNTDEN